jgi:hypothetical protein
MRRDGGLIPKDFIKVYLKVGDKDLKEIISRRQKTLASDVGARKIDFTGEIKDGLLIDRHFEIENKEIWIGINKIC